MGLTNSKARKLFSKPRFINTKSSFPLLNLPSLAIVEVLKGIGLFDLIQLSFASERTRNIVESLVRRNSSGNINKLHVKCENYYIRNNIIMQCEESLSLRIWFRSNNDGLLSESYENSKFPKIFIKLDGITVQIKINHGEYIITVYNDSYTTGLIIFVRFFCRIFNPLVSIDISKGDKLLVNGILDVIKKEKAKLDKVGFCRFVLNDNLYQRLLELPIRKLDLFSYPSSNFQYKLSDESMKIEDLQIGEAQWVRNLEDFLNCKYVVLHNTELRESDLNRFLQKWTESDCQLEFLHVYMHKRPQYLRENVGGLLVEPLNRIYIGNRFQEFDDGECFSFQRSNGEKAYIYQVNSEVIIQNESCQRSPFSW